MLKRETIFQTGDSEIIWKRFCGFLDLTVPEFMDIQKRLLEEQLEVVGKSPLWEKLLNGKKPKTMEEFREMAPLTSYNTHYAQYIGEEGKNQFLIKQPMIWSHSSGRGGKFKWIPWTEEGLEKYADATMAGMILAAADYKNDVNIPDGCRLLSILAPSPYISGISGQALASRFNIKFIPPPEISDKLDFQERIALGLKMALNDGADFVGAISTVLVKVGENMTANSRSMKITPYMLRPPVLYRMLRAYLKSKIEKRPMMPRDLWPVKGIACGGTDTSIYRERLRYFWGKDAHEMYGMSEMGIVAMQSWVKKDMTFYPYLAFLEFIPEEDWLKNRHDPSFTPRTVLINKLEVGKIYEMVITNFHGMYLMRYRPGDLIKVIALEDRENGIKLPHISFYSRADSLIDLYSIVRLDERTLWQAIDNTGVKYEEWSARKEYQNVEPILKIYIELKEPTDPKDLELKIHDELKKGSALYAEAIQEMQTMPVSVKVLDNGSYQHYYEKRKAEGADMAHLKPPHMNPAEDAIKRLLGTD